jgi:hypothetical protein
MDGIELGRRVERLRRDARGLRRLTVLWRAPSGRAATSAANCVKVEKDPARRLEPLRRSVGKAATADAQ